MNRRPTIKLFNFLLFWSRENKFFSTFYAKKTIFCSLWLRISHLLHFFVSLFPCPRTFLGALQVIFSFGKFFGSCCLSDFNHVLWLGTVDRLYFWKVSSYFTTSGQSWSNMHDPDLIVFDWICCSRLVLATFSHVSLFGLCSFTFLVIFQKHTKGSVIAFGQ